MYRAFGDVFWVYRTSGDEDFGGVSFRGGDARRRVGVSFGRAATLSEMLSLWSSAAGVKLFNFWYRSVCLLDAAEWYDAEGLKLCL